MKTKTKYIKHLSIVVIMLTIIGCDDFLDVNENPNDPSISTPDLTLPVAQQALVDINAEEMTYLGQFMTYNWSTPSNWSANQELIQYNIANTFFSNIFEESYLLVFKDLTFVENFGGDESDIDYSAYKAIATILKSFQYQYLVDLYGDIPFSEANLRAENPTPAYDNEEAIYTALIDNLTTAAELALNVSADAENPGTQDIIYGGDMAHWAEFANTIKLRLLVRLSGTGQDAYIQEQLGLIAANGAGYITSNVSANPGYSDNEGKQSPFFGYIGRGPNNTTLDRNDFTVATDYILEYLTTNGDDRLNQLYSEAVNGGYKGAEQTTILPGSGFTSNDLSHVGPGLLVSSEQDQPLMLYSEGLLLQAEATVRGYLPGGDAAAKALYEAAIEESFEYLHVPPIDADATATPPVEAATTLERAQAYHSQPIKNVAWDSSPDKIEAIITQKWIALNGTSSIESWVELTRTGFPLGLPIPAESDGVRPVRLLYPDSEVGRNAINVPTQTKSDAFTNNPFWK
ncbi:SusD/RagB family nutrient-binding outer membrane lipoprotein [uncultured Zobellia sp.]|uniref:SusD/RagB family nutrient-binding outer membrane lipoprotein n=1 Tax=uncultured Zobellia sp. TaxID=255433 RepID=UPI0025933C29|nr:SusD/RagB family nutrient-binding outer membrane lipoprotein [uncultured Zobellia sp.]